MRDTLSNKFMRLRMTDRLHGTSASATRFDEQQFRRCPISPKALNGEATRISSGFYLWQRPQSARSVLNYTQQSISATWSRGVPMRSWARRNRSLGRLPVSSSTSNPGRPEESKLQIISQYNVWVTNQEIFNLQSCHLRSSTFNLPIFNLQFCNLQPFNLPIFNLQPLSRAIP